MPARTPTLHPLYHLRPSHCGTMSGMAMEPRARAMTTTTTPTTRMCCNCVLVADASLRCWGRCQRNEGKEASAMLVTTPAQCRKKQQRTACKDAVGEDACAPPAKSPAQDQPDMKAKSPGNGAGYSNKKPQMTTMSTIMTPRTLTCHDCIMTGRTPVFNAYGDAGATWVESSTTRTKMPMQRGQ
jgi:hypothetical protein